MFHIILAVFTLFTDCCARDFFGSNNQTEYRFEMDHMQLENFSRQYFESVEVMNSKFNRTTKVVHMKFHLMEDVTPIWRLDLQPFMFLSNEYRPFAPLKVNIPFCNAIDQNMLGIASAIYSHGQPAKCPVIKGHYDLDNFVFDSSRAPALLPEAQYRLRFTVYYQRIPAICVSWYGSVIKKLKMRKHD